MFLTPQEQACNDKFFALQLAVKVQHACSGPLTAVEVIGSWDFAIQVSIVTLKP